MDLQHFFKRNILLILTVAVFTLFISTFISIWLSNFTYLEIPSIGSIKTIGAEAYWDKNLEEKIESINWDIIWLGSSKNVTLYLQSISNLKTVLLLNATNWNPTILSKYMNLSWNYNGSSIYPGEVIRVTITLSSSYSTPIREYLVSNDVKEYAFDIVIYAIE